MLRSRLLAVSLLTTVAAPVSAQVPGPARQHMQEGEAADIIVTATKRPSTLQDTPVAVTVTDAETIARAQIRDLSDLQTVVPSLRVSQNASSAQTTFYIRGFGNGGSNLGIEPSVGVFVDGVYRSRAAGQIEDLPNIERVEVLRGPQSTLFGKNASAGVVSIVTAQPQFKFGGNLEASYGNYDARVLKGILTGPITDTVAFSVGGSWNKRDGYVRDLGTGKRTNDRDRWGSQAQLLFKPSDDLSVRLIGDYSEIDERCCAVVNVISGPATDLVRAIGGNVDAAAPFSYRIFNNYPGTNRIRNYGVSGQVDASISDDVSISSISAYRRLRNSSNFDADSTSADLIGRFANDFTTDTFTQELRLASSFSGPLNFLFGGFYFNEKLDTTDELRYGSSYRAFANANIRSSTGGTMSASGLEAMLAPLGVATGSLFAAGQGALNRFVQKNETISVFGQLDFKPVDRLTLTAGINYTNDRKQVRSSGTSNDVFSSLDLVQIGFAQALRARGVNPGSPTAIGAFAAANPAAYSAIVAGAQNRATNPLIGLRPLQFSPPILNFPNAVEDGRTNNGNVSYTLRAAYEISRRLNAYVSYATGFKGSSFNLSRDSRPSPADFIPGSSVVNPATSPIRLAGLALPNLTSGSRFASPEEARVVELGLKLQLRTFSFAAAVFDQRIKNFQSNIFTGSGFYLANAAKQSVRGFELESRASPVSWLSFSAALTYLDAKYDSFPTAGAVGSNLVVVPTDLTGRRPALVPEYTIVVGSDMTKPLTDGVTLIAHVDFNHSSGAQLADGILPLQREVNLLNGSLGLRFGESYEVSVFGRNITQDRFLTAIYPSTALPGNVSGYPSQPRTYGVVGRIRF